jgi:hypothetical protein
MLLTSNQRKGRCRWPRRPDNWWWFFSFAELFPVYARKPLFGYEFVAAASFAITAFSLTMWVLHMF